MIKDVALRAGVSLGTVSRVINGHPSVAPELRQRVQEAIRELEYRPNRVARSLRRQRSSTLGLIIPDVTNPFFAELVKRIESYARQADHEIILRNAEESQKIESRYVQIHSKGHRSIIVLRHYAVVTRPVEKAIR
jgi:LacI family transcriptional regulator